MIDDVAIAADHRDLHAGNRYEITWTGDNVFVFPCSQDLLVVFPDFKGCSARLGVNIRAVVNKRANRNSLHQLRNAA